MTLLLVELAACIGLATVYAMGGPWIALWASGVAFGLAIVLFSEWLTR